MRIPLRLAMAGATVLTSAGLLAATTAPAQAAVHVTFFKGSGPSVDECVGVHANIKGSKKFWYVPNKVYKVWETAGC
ncbi:hypothetical protein [Streptosporangium sp. NBC_01756]|uniref:hypothetical protein n=1 Tax=Streptosporangium sp. NBC_01756 TaxID=2975950 RepID=UPI002DDC3573|nr:hypothetical protein [Streptosporangium sp. NBC_01756]WSC85298.1 hypothetical protein OIE48_33850 [Streptosporangium sp. NBC_01756]